MLVEIAAISYAVCGSAYALAAGLLAGSRAQHRYKLLLLIASLVTAAWAFATAATALAGGKPLALVALENILEQMRSIGWIAVIGFVLFVAYRKHVERHFAMALAAVTALSAAYVLIFSVYAAWAGTVSPGALRVDYIARVLTAVVGLLLVENLFRNSGREGRWAVKYLCFGLGAVFIYDFAVYAEAALFARLDGALFAGRGIVDTLAVPCIIVAAARSKSWPIDIHVSRRLVFHSATLLAAGIYLIAMAGVGYYLRALEDSWGSVAQTVFLAAAGLVLAIVLSSGSVQARLKDFISRNFFSYKYDYRREWVNFIGAISDSLTELSVPERVVRALANLVESTAGALWVLREEDAAYQVSASWNMGQVLPSLAVADPFIGTLCSRTAIIDVARSEVDGVSSPELALPDWLTRHRRAWLVLPLIHGGDVIAFAVLGRARAPRSLDWEDFELLKTAAGQAASYIAESRAVESLTRARRFEDFNRQFAFVVHDIKNLAGQMSLILKNAERFGHKPEFQADVFKTIGDSVRRMHGLLEQLKAGRSGAMARIDTAATLRRLAEVWKLQYPGFHEELTADPVWVMADPQRLEGVVAHLLQNAVDAAGPGGQVRLGLSRESAPSGEISWATVTVADNGPGMDRDFVEQKLFQPMSSTKSTGFGVGAYQVRQHVREMGGQLEVDSVPGRGTRMSVRLPLLQIGASDAPPAPNRERNLRVIYG